MLIVSTEFGWLCIFWMFFSTMCMKSGLSIFLDLIVLWEKVTNWTFFCTILMFLFWNLAWQSEYFLNQLFLEDRSSIVILASRWLWENSKLTFPACFCFHICKIWFCSNFRMNQFQSHVHYFAALGTAFHPNTSK